MYETASHTPYHTAIKEINNVFWHEADWEMVQLCIRLKNSSDPDNKAEWILPWAATAAQHNYGQTLAWRLDKDEDASREEQRYVKVAEGNANRVRVYIAENSHATYFREGEIDAEVLAHAGTQVQYNPTSSEYYDRILRSEVRGYRLLPLERRDRIGIYDWQGGWGGDKYRGPFYNEKKDEDVVFKVVDNPARFHNSCRKIVNNSPVAETELR
jgi:hypothetical protein